MPAAACRLQGRDEEGLKQERGSSIEASRERAVLVNREQPRSTTTSIEIEADVRGSRLRFKTANSMAVKSQSAAARGNRQSFHLQFLTTPTADTAGQSAVLHFDSQRYLFGHVGEGTQRACIQRGVSLKKLDNLFITGKTSWETNGGLIGLILSRADVHTLDVQDPAGKKPALHVHGGPKLLHSVACARRFVFRTGAPLVIHESVPHSRGQLSEPSYVDDNVRVWPLALSAPRSDGLEAGQNAQSSSPSPNDGDGPVAESQHNVDNEQAARKEIVHNMFDSVWRRDRLVESEFQDVNMPATVWLRNSETKDLESFYCTSMRDAPHIRPGQVVQVRNPWPAALVGDLPLASNLPSNVAMSYIVRGHSQRGVFDPKKAAALGVPRGPQLGDLTKGIAVTLPNGTVVSPEQVLGPSQPGKGVAFFDLPSSAYLRDLDSLLAFQTTLLDDVAIVVWTLGPGVRSSPVFEELIHHMSDTQHFISDADTSTNYIVFDSVALSNARLAAIAPAHFSQLQHDPVRDAGVSGGGKLLTTEAGLRIAVEPKYALDRSEIPRIDPAKTLRKERRVTGGSRESSPNDRPLLQSGSVAEPVIITLGTGSALPGKYRNVSATLLRMPDGQGSYLLDCGENTVGQLHRMYNTEEYDELLRDIRMIWISHMHADHHLGTISLLRERANAFDKLNDSSKDRTIYLISEANMIDFVREYRSVEPEMFRRSGLIPLVSHYEAGLTHNGSPFNFQDTDRPIDTVKSCRVSHCWGAQAVTMTFKSGFKISYSGDCRPSKHFCAMGEDSDVLVHEATFDDGMEGDARAKKHCTTAEALGVALGMRAKHVILTHFSQRYQKVPNLENVKLSNQIKFEEVRKDEEAGPIDEAETNATAPDESTIDDSMNDVSAGGLNGDGTTTHHPEDLTAIGTLGKSLTQGIRARPSSRHRSNSVLQAARNMHVCVAFDYMRVGVSEIQSMKDYYPAMEAMFEEQTRKSDERRQERGAPQTEKEKERLQRKEQNKWKERAALERKADRERARKGERSHENRKARVNADVVKDRIMKEQATKSAGSEAETSPTTRMPTESFRGKRPPSPPTETLHDSWKTVSK